MTFWRLVGWDLMMLWRSGAAAATIALLVLMAGLACFTGLSAQASQRAAAAEAYAMAQANMAAPAGQAAPTLRGPHTVRMHIIFEQPPLVDFAIGRTGLDPLVGEAGPTTPLHRVFENYQVDNPQRLAVARFDFAFLVTLVAPLVLIGLCAGLWGEERRTGRLALLISQGATPGRILLARVGARAILVGLPLVIALCAQAVLGGGLTGARGSAFATFLCVGLLGLLFWAGLCVVVNSAVRSGAASAAALLVAWIVLAAAGPSAIAAVAHTIAPAPSRLAFLADARAAEIAAVKDAESLAQAYLNDHPELEQGDFDVPSWVKSRFVVSERIDTAVGPLRAAFEESLSRQAAFAESLQALTPTLAQAIAMTQAAGTGVSAATARQSEARAGAVALREAFGPAIMGGRGVDGAAARGWAIRTIPTHGVSVWTSFVWLATWCLAVWALALLAMRGARSRLLDA